MSALPAVVEQQPAGHTEVAGHAEPTLLGLGAEAWVYVSLTIFFVLAIFVLKAPRKIVDALDAQIARKRADLDEAARIRVEAQALLEEAKALKAQSVADAEAMLTAARTEAEHVLAQAEADTAALIARRGAMAEAKISAAERAAVEDLRREIATVAAHAAERLLSETHSENADRKLADDIISAI
jgi:F-type H+-transporting ATPase subunit b